MPCKCFPLTRKADNISQPVKAWKKINPLVFSGPIEELMSCKKPTSRYDFGQRQSINSCCRPMSRRDDITLTTMTRTSVPLALIMTHLLSSSGNSCVFTSSWLQGATSSKLIVRLLTMTALGVCICAVLSARKLNSSVLSLCRRKLRQYVFACHSSSCPHH